VGFSAAPVVKGEPQPDNTREASSRSKPEKRVWAARARLASLWGSQVARVLADNALRLFVVLEYGQHGVRERESAWHLVTFLFMLPALAFAPVIGAIVNSLPKPGVLTLATLFSPLAVFLFLGWLPLVTWGLIALAAAVYAPTRSALLPAGAEEARVSLPRVNALFEMGAAAAVVAGLMLTIDASRTFKGLFTLHDPILVLYLLGFVFAVPVRFATDLHRPEVPAQAVVGFFRDVGRVWREREARWCLFGLASLRGLITGMTGALIAATLADESADLATLVTIGAYVIGGVALGSLLAGLQKHPRRVLGLVPWGATGLTIGLIVAAAGGIPGPTLCVVLGVMAGLVNVPLAATYQADVPPDARGNAMAVRNLADNVLIAVTAFGLFALAHWAGWGAAAQLTLVAILAGLLALASWWFLRRETVELIVEGCFAVMYRIRAHGPGADQFPLRGPVLVIANHACWMDPMLLAKFIPRSLIPMMTSRFFDIPGVRWMMVHLAQAIRVEVSTFRREVPELKKAVQKLDEGRCVVLFPEGWMRRREDQILRHFGQGVWHILRERPHTPVLICWIEGNWGSYFSYKDGPPTKNKKFDLRRRIDIVFSTPRTLPAELLEDHHATRRHLLGECLALRRYLGLEEQTALVEADETSAPD
jgi:1-acyl-sn-glycerol-3-phosphate acyltransferase